MIKTYNRQITKNYKVQKTNFDDKRYRFETIAVFPQSEVYWAKAVGHSVWDKQGNKWIDMTSGIFVANAGHSNPKIKNAIRKQLDKDVLFAYTYDTAIRTKLAEKIVSVSPDYLDKIIFMNSGTEATDVAYRLIKMWGEKKNKKKIVCFRQGSYVGQFPKIRHNVIFQRTVENMGNNRSEVVRKLFPKPVRDSIWTRGSSF